MKTKLQRPRRTASSDGAAIPVAEKLRFLRSPEIRSKLLAESDAVRRSPEAALVAPFALYAGMRFAEFATLFEPGRRCDENADALIVDRRYSKFEIDERVYFSPTTFALYLQCERDLRTRLDLDFWRLSGRLRYIVEIDGRDVSFSFRELRFFYLQTVLRFRFPLDVESALTRCSRVRPNDVPAGLADALERLDRLFFG